MKMLPKAKDSGVIVPHSDLREGTAKGHTHNMKVLQWNCRGFSHDKKTELRRLLHKEDIDVFGIMETNISKDQKTYYNMKGYVTYLLPKTRQVASGILIGVKTNVMSRFKIEKEMNEADKIEIVKLELWKNKEHFTIYFVYNPPNNIPDLDLLEITNRTILIGDFNAHSKLWGYVDTNSTGKTIEELLNTNKLELIFNKEQDATYTHHTGATTNPDLLMVSSNLAEKTNRRVLESLGSDHRAVLAEIQLNKKQSKLQIKKSWNFKKGNWSEYKRELEEKLPNGIKGNLKSPDNANNIICQILTESAKKHIPRGKVKTYKPFWSKELTQLKNEREEARKNAEIKKDRTSILKWKQKAAVFKKSVITAKRNAYNKFAEKLDYRKDGNKAYKFVSTVQHEVAPKQPMRHENKIITDDLKIASLFNTKYTSLKIPKTYKKEQKLMKKEIKKNKRSKQFYSNSIERIFYHPFTQSELDTAIQKTKNNTAPGPDKIHPEFIKHLGPKARNALLKFYNSIWNTSIPANWKKAIIIPVLKPGKPADNIDSYRPISLTSCIAKIMERMISERLTWYLETNNILSPSQAGFRRNHSTNQQVILLSQDIKEAFNNKEDTLAVFVDLKSAYDNIWRTNLIRKLQHLGITGNMLRCISEFITQRYCATNYGSATSRYKQTRLGVPQGAVLSTTLFNTYINDLANQLECLGVKTALFADDLVIWCSQPSHKTNTLKTIVQTALEKLNSWRKSNLMMVNTAKTTFQLFSLRNKTTEIELHSGGTKLQRTENAKYINY